MPVYEGAVVYIGAERGWIAELAYRAGGFRAVIVEVSGIWTLLTLQPGQILHGDVVLRGILCREPV